MAEINKLSSYPIKYLTYSEMQQLRDQGLCLNCNDIDIPNHHCSIHRFLIVLPDEVPHMEQLPLELLEPTDLKASQFQSLSAPQQQQPSISSLTNSSSSETASISSSPISADELETISQPPKSDSLILPALKLLFDQSIAARDDSSHRKKESVDKDIIKLSFLSQLDNSKIANGESTIQVLFVFDPGGTFTVESIYDLEDKVIFEDNHAYLHLAKLLSNPSTTSASLQNFGERKPLIFDPGGQNGIRVLV